MTQFQRIENMWWFQVIPLQDIALAKHCKGFLKTDAPTENMKTMFCLAVWKFTYLVKIFVDCWPLPHLLIYICLVYSYWK